jgi:hypothetical protein
MSTQFSQSRVFAHSENPNGTIDSICHLCFSSVARGVLESQLAAFEEKHVCTEWRLKHYRKLRKAVGAYRERVTGTNRT